MLRKRLLLITLFAGGSVLACAQQSAAKAPSIPPAAPVTKADPLKLSTGIRASYYHPDDLSALDCGVVLDWNSVFKQLNQTVPADRLKVLNGMTIEVHARRGKSTSEQFSWANGAPTDSEHLENGAKQMLDGFFQMYWPIIGASMAPGPADKATWEDLGDRGYFLRYGGDATTVDEEFGRDYLPTRISVKSPAMNAEMVPHFSASANPVPGDLRRLTSMDVKETMGTTTISTKVTLDYQTVGGFNIPQHVAVGVGGAYSVPMELIGCAVSREVTVAVPSKIEPEKP